MIALCSAAAGFAPAEARATTYIVNSAVDLPDANPGNNICETAAGNGVCTLRAAVQESNSHAGPDSITLQANATHVLAAGLGPLYVSDSVAIAAADPNAIIDGNGPVTLEQVLHIVKCVNDQTGAGGTCSIGNVTAGISGVTITRGRSNAFGGGIYNAAALTLVNCTVTDNVVVNGSGGGIYNVGSLTIESSTISLNSAGSPTGGGGGIYNERQLTIINSTIRGNATAGNGGGIRNVSNSTIIRGSTISGNTATNGGGMHAGGSGSALINSTVSGNFARADGGGIYVISGTVALYNSTVALNLANADSSGTAIGGGIYNGFGNTVTLANSIVSLNESELPGVPFPTILADDCAGAITSQGNSIVSDVDPNHCTVNGTYAATYANLGSLQDNGGSTLTHSIAVPSPAVDAGNTGGCVDNLGAQLTTDQRGFGRPQGLRCDIGAFEASDRFFADGFES